MLLSELIDASAGMNIPAIEINGITADSRNVRKGYLFAALSGAKRDGARFISDAVAKGAAAILVERQIEDLPPPVPVIADENPRRRLALLAARFYGKQPAHVVAVTGTSGKTSVASFARQLWSIIGQPAASLGTLGVVAPDFTEKLEHTTPDPVTLHEHLARLKSANIDRLAMEASSHGLDQFRLDGVQLQAAAFTNLTRDHLDYHPTPEDYLTAKLRLFKALLPSGATAVVNADSDVYAAVRSVAAERGLRLLSYGREGRDLRILMQEPHLTGQRLKLEIFGRKVDIDLSLIGGFQAGNALAAYALVSVVEGERLRPEMLAQLVGVPGRMEHVATRSNGAAIFVDYAHKPDALESALLALRPHAQNRIHLVFGCGGDRDAGKRPLMGAIAARLADQVIVTDDNPRSEQPALIRQAILAGCPNALEIGDRAQAIAYAVKNLASGDLLLIAGKGHEIGQIVGQEVHPFNDAEVAQVCVQQAEK